MKNEVLEMALQYIAWGWKVLPLLPDAKIPLGGSSGVHDATTNKEKITSWFKDNPNLNIGIAAGKESGIIVFDVDPRNGGEESWREWQDQNGKVPDGVTQITAGGGEHYLCEYTEALASCKLAPGVDVLSDGRYFVVYPSTINERQYIWEASSDPRDGIAPFTLPDAWLQAHQNSTNGRRKLILPEVIIKGNIHDGMVSMAGAMRQYGMSELEIHAALKVANDNRCETPLPASEVRRIARDVASYDTDADVAADAALGSRAVETLLQGIKEQRKEFYFTSGTSLMSQPSPVEWSIKHWIPRQGQWLLYGPSGVGKSFLALSIACSIAHGLEWFGNKTKQGYVVYLAGEGNYGMRSRIAAWSKYNGVSGVDNLLVSNRAVDMDASGVDAAIIGEIQEILPEGASVEMIIIDTLNNHMSGDENSARDTRAIFNAARNIAIAYDANVGIVHHVGNNEEAQNRARGSSAIKATMDAQISLKKSGDNIIEIKCTKMKDALEPEPFFGTLEAVDLGWVDEDGENQPGAVFVMSDHEPIEKDPLHKDKKIIESAWCWSGYDVDNEARPYLTFSALRRWLVEEGGKSESTANVYTQINRDDRLVGKLIAAKWLKEYQNGIVIIDDNALPALMFLKSDYDNKNK